jgi:hypothetical protein
VSLVVLDHLQRVTFHGIETIQQALVLTPKSRSVMKPLLPLTPPSSLRMVLRKEEVRFCDADAVGEGLLTGFLPSQTHLVNGELCPGGALGGVESCGNLSNRSPAQGKRDVLLELALQCLPRHTPRLGRGGLSKERFAGPVERAISSTRPRLGRVGSQRNASRKRPVVGSQRNASEEETSTSGLSKEGRKPESWSGARAGDTGRAGSK